jgi:hypothetical protein
MTSSLQAFLAGILDYAGLFPPAQLPLDQAIQAYVRYRRDPNSWLLGRFICPAERLDSLSPFVLEFSSSEPALAISALGRGGKSVAELSVGLRADLDAIASFVDRHDGRVDIAVYEVRVPGDVLAARSKASARKFLDETAGIMAEAGLPSLTAYYEPPRGADWRSSLMALSTALAESNHAGVKLRCGGLEARAFPSPEQVAIAITACRDAGVPLKFTAGLHHPIRQYSAELQTQVHGFLNIFGAGILAHARQLTEEQVRRIIDDEDAEHFAFAAEKFRWKSDPASVPEIRAARRSAVISFGSCSFDEPCDDLRRMGLLT